MLLGALEVGNVLLAGPPGTGKTALAKRIAELAAVSGSCNYIIAVAHSLWFRRDLIGGESLRPDGVFWKAGLFIKAYNMAAEMLERACLNLFSSYSTRSIEPTLIRPSLIFSQYFALSSAMTGVPKKPSRGD